MVQTRSVAKKIDSTQVHTNESEIQEGTSANDAPPPAKKTRREDTEALNKRRRVKPGELCQLNLDVLFLIAAYIHSVDLLNLARTCKSLRQLLMDKSSTFVWMEARRQVRGLPPCPADLTEPEYANLVFCARCHECGKYTTTILWNVRRRFCPGCRIRRLRLHSSCNEVIRKNKVLAEEYITVKKECQMRVDKDQAASFMAEYRQSSDKEQFISDKQKQRSVIIRHARKCEVWQEKRELEHKQDKKARQGDRHRRIFQCLEQLGYSPEIGYFSRRYIQSSRLSDFRTSKPLTDKEWVKIRPEWVKIMNDFRSRRLESQVYRPRRNALISAYNNFYRFPSPDAPTFDLLPHVDDLARFPPVRDVIQAPEEIQVNDESFASAFAQLPVLVAEWKRKLDVELANLVKIPSRLPSANCSSRRALAPRRTTQSSSTDLDRLQLACALFQTDHAGVFTHLEVFSVSMLNRTYKHCEDDSEHSVLDRFGVQFLEEAPYIVHACGLDPNVATVDDMDHRDARLKCLSCEGGTLIMNWRRAMWHASVYHRTSRTLAPLPKSPRWQLVSNEHIDAIQTVEQSIEKDPFPNSVRCLLCRPHVGDVIRSMQIIFLHLNDVHKVKAMSNVDTIQGVHYAPIGICDPQSVAVEMVEEGDRVSFKVPKVTDPNREGILAKPLCPSL
ncbi:hypothetical protein L210DRAFT_1053936 [Boletus edulis BED1]|uniref:F-box domain-containing protein n=1 Tax=Boletus edulis BED1 TaxID=1328754 RepID=A0AAD4GCC9_BOLED|nr:hypothetical protein L210DRAFT_1053936 [Boletus edulis BED1]